MKINRYTNITPAQYNPMSLEELMMVPMLKRKQHDELLNNIAATQSALAQTDYLDVHEDKVLGIRKKLEEELQRQVEAVSGEGINEVLKNDFINLNAEYQNAMGTKGTLGKAQAAKQALAQEKATYLQNSTQMGYSPTDAADNWQRHQQGYYNSQQELDDITNIEGLYAPTYKNVVDEFNKVADRIGMDSTEISKLRNSMEFDEESGMYYLQENSKTTLTEENLKKFKKAETWLNNNLMNPNSDLRRSIDHQNKTPEEAFQEIAGLGEIYATKVKKVQTDTRISNLTAAPTVEGNEVIEKGVGIVAAGQQYAPATYSNKSTTELTGRIRELEAKGEELTQEEQVELSQLNRFHTKVYEQLKEDNQYLAENTTLTRLRKDIEAMDAGTYDYSNDAVYKEMHKRVFSPGLPEEQKYEYVRQEKMKLLEAQEDKVNDIADKYLHKESLKMTAYQFQPKTSKQRTQLNLLNETTGNVLKNDPQALNNLGQVTEVFVGEDVYALGEEDADNISKLSAAFFNGNAEDIGLVNFTFEGMSGKPELTFRLNNPKEAVELDGSTGIFRGDHVVGEEGKPIQVKVALDMKDMADGGYHTLYGKVLEYMADSGEEGAAMVEAMQITHAYTEYEGYSWGRLMDANVPDKDLRLAPIMLNAVEQKLKELRHTNPDIEAPSTEEEVKEFINTHMRDQKLYR
jgi:hypothetical protein